MTILRAATDELLATANGWHGMTADQLRRQTCPRRRRPEKRDHSARRARLQTGRRNPTSPAAGLPGPVRAADHIELSASTATDTHAVVRRATSPIHPAGTRPHAEIHAPARFRAVRRQRIPRQRQQGHGQRRLQERGHNIHQRRDRRWSRSAALTPEIAGAGGIPGALGGGVLGFVGGFMKGIIEAPLKAAGKAAIDCVTY